jgi:hypothetical protein
LEHQKVSYRNVSVEKSWFVSKLGVTLLKPSKVAAQEVFVVGIYQMDIGFGFGRTYASLETRRNLIDCFIRGIGLDYSVTDDKYYSAVLK